MTKELISGREKFGNDWMANVGGAIPHIQMALESSKGTGIPIDNG